MSDTPRTNAAWNEGFDPVILSAAQLARRLRKQCAELERENAALRADKERLDWVIKDSYYHFFFKLSSDLEKGRRQIDAARKEAQP